jgi:hypothetical protein
MYSPDATPHLFRFDAGNESDTSREGEFILWRQLLMRTSKAPV